MTVAKRLLIPFFDSTEGVRPPPAAMWQCGARILQTAAAQQLEYLSENYSHEPGILLRLHHEANMLAVR